jgi:hypothetical protein
VRLGKVRLDVILFATDLNKSLIDAVNKLNENVTQIKVMIWP